MAGYRPIGDANASTLELGERFMIGAVDGRCPVVACLLGADPTRDVHRFLEQVVSVGFDCVMNCPTVALINGKFRLTLEGTGLGYEWEV